VPEQRLVHVARFRHHSVRRAGHRERLRGRGAVRRRPLEREPDTDGRMSRARARTEGDGRGAVFSREERTLPAEHPSPAPTLGRRFPTRALAVKKAGPDRRRKTERAEVPGLSRTRREGMSSSGNVPCLPSARRRPIRVATGARGQLWPAHSASDAVFGSRFAKARQRALL
jgi:hypothetical protein